MANSFEVSRDMVMQNLKKPGPERTTEPAGPQDSFLGLERKEKGSRGAVTLYLDKAMMDRVRRICKRQGVTIGAFVEVCIKQALEKLDRKE